MLKSIDDKQVGKFLFQVALMLTIIGMRMIMHPAKPVVQEMGGNNKGNGRD